MCIKPVLPLVAVICDLKRIRHKLTEHIQTRLSYISIMFNLFLDLFHLVHPDTVTYQINITEFSL